MSDILKRFSSLSEKNKGILIKRLDSSSIDPLDRPILPRYEHYERYPLTYEQKQIWMMHKMSKDLDPYNINICVELMGYLDVDALRKSYQRLIQKHCVFRTTFIEDKGVAYQVAIDFSNIDFNEHNIEINDEILEYEYALSKVKEIAKKKFDLSKAPIIKAYLFKINDDRYIMSIITHHIIVDGWSVGIILQELCDEYAEVIGDSFTTKSKNVNIDYLDYAIWRDKIEGSIKYSGYVNNYASKLKDFNWECKLPYDRIKPTVLSSNGSVYSFVIKKELLSGYKEEMKNNNITCNMLFLSLFSILLYRLSDKELFTIGMPVVGRDKTDLFDVIGLFSSTIIFRCDLRGNPRFFDYLIEVKNQLAEQIGKPIVPLEKTVEILHPKRSLNLIPFLQVDYVYDNLPTPNITMQDLTTRVIRVNTDTAKFELKLTVKESLDEYELEYEYSTDLFNVQTIELLGLHFVTLFKQFSANIYQRICDVSLISEKELLLLNQWNMQEYDYNTNLCIHDLFEKQVLETPNNIAVIDNEVQLTYNDFNCLVNQTANRLIKIGIDSGMLIGLYISHSVQLLACIYALLKLGAIYVPINRQYPYERIKMIVDDIGLAYIISESDLQSTCRYEGCVIDVDELFDNIEIESKDNIGRRICSSQAAYILYTSGTTGNPKGVITSHSNVVNHIIWAKNTFVKDDNEVWALFTSIAHDLTVVVLFTPLICGDAIAIYSDKIDDFSIKKIVEDRVATIIKCTPYHLILFKEVSEYLNRSKIRCFIVGGAMLKSELCKSIYEIFDRNVDIYNVCGPTETTVSCMGYHYDKNREYCYNIPLGKPAYNVKLYVLDNNLSIQPIGVEGEIYVSGYGISPGYINNPELTSCKFLKNPFTQDSGYEIMYKSGDIGRWLPDGNIELIGRKDKQVKIRGYRVELGDIEVAIMSYENIQNAIVNIYDIDEENDTLLCAYIVSSTEVCFDSLRAFLSRKLPDYMIPRYYIQIPKIPLNLNGKIDVSKLPTPILAHDNIDASSDFDETNIIEKILIEVFERILGIGSNKRSNFFDLNGDSIKAIQIVSRLREYGIKIDIRDVFQYQTVLDIAKHASYVDDREKNDTMTDCITNKYPITPSQERMLFYSLFYKENQPFFQQCSFKIKGILLVDEFIKCIERLPDYYEVFKTSFSYKDLRHPYQYIREHIEHPCFYEDISDLSEKEQHCIFEECLKKDSEKGFLLNKDCLSRVYIFKINDDVHQVLWSYHHIILDGWSIGNVCERLLQDYYYRVNNMTIEHVPVKRFVEFVNWLSGKDHNTSWLFWKKYLNGYQAMEQLKPIKSFEGTENAIAFNEKVLILKDDISNSVNEYARINRVTVNVFFDIIWAVALMVINNVDDVVFGSVVSGRPSDFEQAEKMVGLFVNTIPIRIRNESSCSIKMMMQQFNEVSLDLYKNSYISLLDLQSMLGMSSNIIDHIIVFENYKKMDTSFNRKVELEIYDIFVRYSTNYDMNVIIIPDDTIKIAFQYKTDKFCADNIEYIIKLVDDLIKKVLDFPNITVDDLLKQYRS